MAPHIRPRPSLIDLLPEECEGIVAWAAQELANTASSQKQIYEEFSQKLRDLREEADLDFQIPHYVSFTRHNVKLAKITKQMRQAQLMAEAVNDRTDGQDADALTQSVSRMLKTMMVEMMTNAMETGFVPKEAAAVGMALERIAKAENISTARRQKLQEELATKTKQAVQTVAKQKGLSAEATDEILSQILGVKK